MKKLVLAMILVGLNGCSLLGNTNEETGGALSTSDVKTTTTAGPPSQTSIHTSPPTVIANERALLTGLPYLIPELVGLSVKEATDWAEASGYDTIIVHEAGITYPPRPDALKHLTITFTLSADQTVVRARVG